MLLGELPTNIAASARPRSNSSIAISVTSRRLRTVSSVYRLEACSTLEGTGDTAALST
ncbi:hypothetical protein D9M72_274560 [compost metagenome]